MWSLPFIPSYSLAKARKYLKRAITEGSEVSEDESRLKVEKAFKKYDIDHNHELDYHEFAKAINSLKIALPDLVRMLPPCNHIKFIL